MAISLFALCVFAQNPQKPETSVRAWKILQDAQLAFEMGNFGESIRLADAAKQQRKNEAEWAMYTIEQALKPVSVQRVGDDIAAVTKILSERNAEDALLIIHEVLLKYSSADLHDSITQLKEKIALFNEYPEADFLLGRLYTLEGEYAIADSYLLNAWRNCGILDIPNEKYDILYQMAYLAKLQKDNEKYEKNLLLIVADDNYVGSDGSDGSFIRAVKQSLQSETMTIDKLFMLYRSKAYTSLDAYYQLAYYYAENDQNEKALTMSTLAALASFTRMHEALKERDMEYSYTTFLSYLEKTGRYYDIAEWGAKNGIWKGYFIYAQILYKNNKVKLAEEMLSNLSRYCPEDFWRNVAVRELLNHS